ncbi:ABC transporter substrate-binding protein [Sabulicella glaciei]|uniref:ABC transporter substrate-binding protein n=1 Tax=Sabulicella glaciei TaxID=2984948 RepID=A0ABT3NYY1_9PROT|nr:ABC transporter substrate-binding protein [Roseococcus sp. MDT2-1-1]MCW8086784.1 ABC transporter substrate-binding protein [Roseococcus sp. MDT2-1-1]
MPRFRVNRRAALGLAAGPLLLPVAGRARAQGMERLSFLSDWRAQAEHGGFYQAQAAGLYRAAGLEVELRTGGPQINPAQLLVAGRVDMSMGSALESFNYVREGLPFLTIAAIFQKEAQVLLGHPNTGLTGFEALRGRTVLVGAQARTTWWPFLRRKYGLRDEQARPYTFNPQPFLADRMLVQQGYLGSEPFSLRQAGVDPVVLMIADAGFENYNTTIQIGRQTMERRREAVQRFVDATLQGWAQYLDPGTNVADAHALIRRDNPDMPEALLDYGRRMMNEAGIVRSGDAVESGIGAMTEARWRRFFESMAEVEVVPRALDWRRAFELSFVNKGIGRG